MIIGVDPHKSSHTATAVDPATNTAVASLRVEASLAGYRQLLRWASQFTDRRWAVENARGLGRHLAQWLVARDEDVVDVACTATARVRELSRGGGRKNDVIDAAAAAAAASVAALHGDAVVVRVEDHTTVFAMLEERRSNVAAHRVRVVNRLHALFRDLIPGGAPVALTAAAASALLRSVRPAGAVESTRKDLAQDMVRELRLIDTNLAAIEQRMSNALDQSGSRLRTVDGIGPILAARLIGRRGPASRFASSDAFATYAGVAPIEIASADKKRHRLSRAGDRQLNAAIHLIAVTQVRMARSRGRAYFDKKTGEGKTRNEAMRCLKRRLANHIWRTMIAARWDARTDAELLIATPHDPEAFGVFYDRHFRNLFNYFWSQTREVSEHLREATAAQRLHALTTVRHPLGAREQGGFRRSTRAGEPCNASVCRSLPCQF